MGQTSGPGWSWMVSRKSGDSSPPSMRMVSKVIVQYQTDPLSSSYSAAAEHASRERWSAVERFTWARTMAAPSTPHGTGCGL